jgi:tetratricopeptide (TPR) repeat protein
MLMFLFAHICICILYPLLLPPRLPRQERFCRSVIVLFIPFFGFLALVLSDLFKFRAKSLDMPTSHNRYEYKYRETVDHKKTNDLVPLEEVLLINDASVKRKVLLEIFKTSPERYVRNLKSAMNDPDTETSHYASAALMEIKRKYVNSLIKMGETLKENPEDMESSREYAELLYKYISSGILETQNLQRYKEEFVAIAGRLLSQEDRNLNPNLYAALISAAYETGQEEASYRMAEQLLSLYPDSETSYFAQMKLFYQSGRMDDLRITLQMLKNSSVILSKDGLSMIRFFIGAV